MLGNAAAENRCLRAQVDALQAAEATQGYLKGSALPADPKIPKISKIFFFKNLILVVLEPRDYQNLLGHVI